MIKRQDFLKNVNDILEEESIEGQPLSNIDILKSISKDDNLMNLFYLEFESYFPYEDGTDMLYSKTEDFLYRLNLVIKDWLIPIRGINSIEEIKKTFVDLIFEGADFYSAVSFDDSDKEIVEELEEIYPRKEHNIT